MQTGGTGGRGVVYGKITPSLGTVGYFAMEALLILIHILILSHWLANHKCKGHFENVFEDLNVSFLKEI